VIFRQIYKHWKGLLPVFIAWAVGGYYLFKYKHAVLAELSHWFISLPAPGEQDQHRAFEYVTKSRERLSRGNVGLFCRILDTEGCQTERNREGNIRLGMMREACRRYSGKYRGDEIYRPHWLEKIRRWKLRPAASSGGEDDPEAIVHPVHYWKTNRGTVLASLRDLIDATSFAYEISPKVSGEKKIIYLPEEIAEHAGALCMDEIGLLTWGDYVAFQEDRALRRLKKKSPDFERVYTYRDERDLVIWRSLKKDPRYIRALREYSAGSPPSDGDPGSCRRGDRPRLSCLAPTEALNVFNKLLYLAPKSEQPHLRLRLGLLYVLRVNIGEKRFLTRALDNLHLTAHQAKTERDARMNLARIYLKNGDYRRAYEQVKEMWRRDYSDRETRNIIRLTLMKLGRFADADCFADMAELKHGRRPHCRDLQL